MNKKGYYRFADMGMFFLGFVIIGVAVAGGIFIFYGSVVDVREQESIILSDKLVNAIVADGNLKEEVFEKDFNILKEAGLNEVFKNGDYFFRVEIDEKIFVEGNRDFEVECDLNGKNFPVCFNREFFIDGFKVKVLTAVRQIGSKV